MTTGIYILVFDGTDKVYVGQSTNIERRLTAHISKFKRGIHAYKLQAAYTLYGTPTLHVLETCEEENLDTNENIYIDEFNAVNDGFNSMYKAGGGCSLCGEDAGNSKFSNIEIEKAFIYLVDNAQLTSMEISKLTGVSKDTIDAIAGGKVHLWLQDIYHDKYVELMKRPIAYSKNKTLKDIGKNYPRLVSPEGVAYTIDNCAEFSRIHNLNNSHIIQVLKGKEKSHKGWKAERIE